MSQSALRIYAGYAGTRRLRVHQPVPIREVRSEPPPVANAPEPIDPLLIEALDAPLDGETIEIAFRRKEARLKELLASLTAARARILHGRLSAPAPDDPVAERFARLAADRRERVLAYLADVRRRAAQARGRSNGGSSHG